MIIDSHAHCAPAGSAWNPAAGPTSAEARRLQEAHRDLPPTVTDSQLLETVDASGVDMVLAVTPSVMRFDNSYSLAAAREHPRRIRAVAHVDPHAQGVGAAVLALAGDPAVVGLRVMLLAAGGGSLLDALELWTAAVEHDMPVAVFAPGRGRDLDSLARAFPDLRLIVDHAGCDIVPGGPPRDAFSDWDAVLALAVHPRVVLKVSGLPEASGERPPFPAARRRLEELIHRFGAERLMWGSNFPPVTRACSYAAALGWLADWDVLSDGDRTRILGGTAARVYGLDAAARATVSVEDALRGAEGAPPVTSWTEQANHWHN